MIEIQAKRILGHSQVDESAICYWKSSDGTWMLYLPGCGIGGLPFHTVEEHLDGTITVKPSVLMNGHKNGEPTLRHGFLTRGVWKDCA
jgi:hypothetical protein